MTILVCMCKGVTDDTIVEAIKNGADTFEKVVEATGATTGPCKGGRCRAKVEELLATTNENN